MRKHKIDPYNYPLIIITAFVIGLVLALALGFRPEHGATHSNGHGYALPPQVWTIDPGEVPRR